MFGLKERPYSAHVMISILCDSDNKNFAFRILEFLEFLGTFQFCSFWLSSKFGDIAIHPCSDYF